VFEHTCGAVELTRAGQVFGGIRPVAESIAHGDQPEASGRALLHAGGLVEACGLVEIHLRTRRGEVVTRGDAGGRVTALAQASQPSPGCRRVGQSGEFRAGGVELRFAGTPQQVGCVFEVALDAMAARVELAERHARTLSTAVTVPREEDQQRSRRRGQHALLHARQLDCVVLNLAYAAAASPRHKEVATELEQLDRLVDIFGDAFPAGVCVREVVSGGRRKADVYARLVELGCALVQRFGARLIWLDAVFARVDVPQSRAGARVARGTGFIVVEECALQVLC
jgi:hypothetical protein